MTSLPAASPYPVLMTDSAPEPDDRALVAAALAGDEDAFRILYRRHTPRLRKLVQRLCGSRGPESDDAVQEVWFRAMTGAAEFRWGSALQSWLCAIAVHVVSEATRAARRDTVLSLDHDVAGPHADLAAQIDIDAAIARVPEHYRVVFVLHDIEGHTHEEIAAQLGMAVGTSKSNLHRARRIMRGLLGHRFAGESS
jgi:RNA polymerase sigma-70 factor (ECF subfamily)